MSKKQKLAKINCAVSKNLLEIKAILEALSDIEQACYPSNVMIDIAKSKVINVFYKVELTRKLTNPRIFNQF